LCKKFQFIILNNHVKKLVGLRLALFTVIYALSISVRYRCKSNLIWSRDIFLSLLLSFTTSSYIVCEIHRKPSSINLFCLSILRKRHKVVFAIISRALSTKLGFKEYESVIAPMSVTSNEIEYFSKTKIQRKKKIIYVGNLFSGSHKLNVNLINELAHEILYDYPEWIIEVIGINRDSFRGSCAREIPSNLSIIERLGRQDVMIKLAESKIGLVIYPNDEYFHDSFPIKIPEYSAARLAIIASETKAHRNILDESRCIYFKSDSLTSLKESLVRLIGDEKLQLKLAQNSFKWVGNLTYERRVEVILKQVELKKILNSTY
jgi:hypothetical protein